MKLHPIRSITFALLPLLASCAQDIIFATHTSGLLDVSGDIAKVPDHVSLGFRRREIAYVGKNVPKDASVLGKIDSETNWNGGVAIRETFATGPAADAISEKKALTESEAVTPAGEAAFDDTGAPKKIAKPVVFASRTRIGFSYSMGGSDDDAVPSLHLGYSRRVATHMIVPPKAEAKDIPSVVADTTVHGSGILGASSAPNTSTTGVHPDARISPGSDGSTNNQGGIRIRQIFAVGKGASSLLKDSKTSAALKANITQSPEGNTN